MSDLKKYVWVVQEIRWDPFLVVNDMNIYDCPELAIEALNTLVMDSKHNSTKFTIDKKKLHTK
jgi:hypothetical protein